MGKNRATPVHQQSGCLMRRMWYLGAPGKQGNKFESDLMNVNDKL